MAKSWYRPGFWSLPVLLLAPQLLAQGIVTEKPELQVGWHTVRPGDTLEGITEHYLGTHERWRENWELNEADVGDPDLIYPGERIRVLLGPSLPADGALIYKMARTVEDQLLPFEWNPALPQDLLRPKDQVRTGEKASATLIFFDTQLILTEKSLVSVGASERTPQVDRAQIEIQLGQADLAGRVAPESKNEIEIVLGDATAKPRAGPEGAIETRARRPEGGGAQVMVYRGASELAAAGAEITVPQGMGSAVPEGEPPSPPEKLLDPPAGLEPAAGSQLPAARPTFRWQPVAGARSYTVEVCGDVSCGELVEREVGVGEPSWQPAELPVADLYWRVTAVSGSGLDGYPSRPVRFAVLAEVDREPPAVALRFVPRREEGGPQDPPRPGYNERLIVGPDIKIKVEAEADDVEERFLILDGEETASAEQTCPWTEGEHTAAAAAVDAAGNRAQSEPTPFVVDSVPPRFRWGLEDVGIFGDLPPERMAAAEGPAPAKRGRQTLEADGREWFADSDFTQIILRPVGRRARVPGVDRPLKPKRGLWILAEDDLCPRVEELSYDIEPGPVLVVEAVDCVGNRSRMAWPLAKDGS